MSKPALRPTDHDIAADAELRLWPGVTYRREHIAKHRRLVLYFGDRSRFVTYPTTSVNFFGPTRHVADIKRVLAEMGATRIRADRSECRKHHRRRQEASAPLRLVRDEPLRWDPSRDPWEPLMALFQEKAA